MDEHVLHVLEKHEISTKELVDLNNKMNQKNSLKSIDHQSSKKDLKVTSKSRTVKDLKNMAKQANSGTSGNNESLLPLVLTNQNKDLQHASSNECHEGDQQNDNNWTNKNALNQHPSKS